jgi:antitoxin VapB
MALNIKDPATEELARELAALTGEKITHAVKTALQDRLRAESRRLETAARRARARRVVERVNKKASERPSSDHGELYDDDGLPK